MLTLLPGAINKGTKNAFHHLAKDHRKAFRFNSDFTFTKPIQKYEKYFTTRLWLC
ncbi:hypothetical protein DYBT9275_00944 [Dyadobacter sp. CECT 9275]|uniref:Uncharacterized protein n=1 Tax=Dyadobacter helix TaxID=2822344 RepID=A0A916JB27_9BACT|nr:hypothetical protein DYBT9275_00944 [Dyadobacter sp. CECT 9275]